MATVRTSRPPEIDYPDSDGRPMAETPRHRKVMNDTIETLDVWFADDLRVYVAGNMFIYYIPGDRLRHVAPDVFVVKGVEKAPAVERRRYLTWEEGKGPDVAIEITSESTREEDFDDKFALYQKVLKVKEYFLFDPYGEYLRPRLQGYRLQKGRYVHIKPVKGRLPSQVLGLHLEARNGQLRLYDPATGTRLPTPLERAAAAEAREARAETERARAETERARAETERARAEQDRQQEAAARQRAEAEIARLRRELETLRQRPPAP
jgi:Uma2 family endonuclease